jgi:hypothetical protein
MSDGIDARPKNWLVPVALALLRKNSTHGYELMERLRRASWDHESSNS